MSRSNAMLLILAGCLVLISLPSSFAQESSLTAEQSRGNWESLGGLYALLADRGGVDGHPLARKSVRSPSRRLRFGRRSDPDMLPQAPNNFSTTLVKGNDINSFHDVNNPNTYTIAYQHYSNDEDSKAVTKNIPREDEIENIVFPTSPRSQDNNLLQTIIDSNKHEWNEDTKTIFCQFYMKNSSSYDSLLQDYCSQHIRRHKRSIKQDHDEVQQQYVLHRRELRLQRIQQKLGKTPTTTTTTTTTTQELAPTSEAEYEEYADRTMKNAYELLDEDETDTLIPSSTTQQTTTTENNSTDQRNNHTVNTKARIFPRKINKLQDQDDIIGLPTDGYNALSSGEHDRSKFSQRRKERRLQRIKQKLQKSSTFWWTTTSPIINIPTTKATFQLPGMGSFVQADPAGPSSGDRIDTIRISPNAAQIAAERRSTETVTAGIESQQKPIKTILHSKTGRLFDNDDVDLPPADYYSKNKEFQSEEDKPRMEAELSLPDLDKWSEKSWQSFFVANGAYDLHIQLDEMEELLALRETRTPVRLRFGRRSDERVVPHIFPQEEQERDARAPSMRLRFGRSNNNMFLLPYEPTIPKEVKATVTDEDRTQD